MSNNYRDKSIFGVYWMTLMSISTIGIRLLITMVLSRLLEPYEFGVVAGVQIVISFADILWKMGVGPAIVQKKQLTSDDILTGNLLNIIFGLTIYIVILLFSQIIANAVGIANINILRILSIVFVIHSISGVSEALLQKDMEFKVIAKISIISLVVYGSMSMIFAFSGFGAWALVIGQIAQAITKSILYVYVRPIKLTMRISKKSLKELMYFGTGFTISRFFNNFANQGDYLVVNRYLGSISMGYYNRSYQMLMIPTNITATVIDKVLFPLVSKFQDDYEKLRYVFVNITSISALLAFPITIVALIYGKELIVLVLGPQWTATVIPFKILISGLFFRMTYKICGSMIRGLGAIYRRLWTQIAYAIMVIVGAYIGKIWGIEGVAVGVTIAIVLNYIILVIFLKKLIGVELTDLVKRLLPIIVVSFFIGFISFYLANIIELIPFVIIRIIILTIFVVILFSLAVKFLLFRVLPDEFEEFIMYILSLFTRRINQKIEGDFNK